MISVGALLFFKFSWFKWLFFVLVILAYLFKIFVCYDPMHYYSEGLWFLNQSKFETLLNVSSTLWLSRFLAGALLPPKEVCGGGPSCGPSTKIHRGSQKRKTDSDKISTQFYQCSCVFHGFHRIQQSFTYYQIYFYWFSSFSQAFIDFH